MKTIKRILSRIPAYLLWAVLSFFFWGWVMGLVNDTTTFHKISIYIDCAQCRDLDLAVALEEDAPEGIRKVKVHPLSYVVFDESTMMMGDILILRQERLEGARDALCPLGDASALGWGEQTLWQSEGQTYGLRVYDAQTGEGILPGFVEFLHPGEPATDFYMVFLKNSQHLGALNGSGDTAALEMARRLLATAPEKMTESSLAIAPVENIPDDFILGMDASSVIAMEESGAVYRGFDGAEQDVFATLAQAGVTHIRVRVWNDPYDSQGRGFGGGSCDLPKAAAIGRRAAEQGLKLIVDFHYSDFWADPGKQRAPRAWEGLSLEEKEEALYQYTSQSLQTLLDAGAQIAMVQVGNETNSGLCGETEWAAISGLMNAGARAVREKCPEARVAVHFANPEKEGAYLWFAEQLRENGVDYDVFASSYYPYWHGSLDNLASVLTDVAQGFDKQVMVMETSYAYTGQDLDFHNNTISDETVFPKSFPFTPQGQAEAVRAVVDTVVNATANGIGVVYWEGAWIAAGTESREENARLWEQFGCGWASSFASEYDPEDAGRWYGGCAVENQAMFDSLGYPLESLKVFDLVRQG